MPKGEKVKKQRAKKDKDAPKRAISAYFYYNQERRPQILKENPKISNKDIIKQMSQEWNALAADKKKPYEAKAEADKKRYLKEKEEYDKKKKTEKK